VVCYAVCIYTAPVITSHPTACIFALSPSHRTDRFGGDAGHELWFIKLWKYSLIFWQRYERCFINRIPTDSKSTWWIGKDVEGSCSNLLWHDAQSRNSVAGARRPLLSNDSEITFPLQHIATNESLSGKKLLEAYPRQRVHNQTVTTEYDRTRKTEKWLGSESTCFRELSRATQRGIRYPEGVECVNCYNRV
jgi:hypothetical protein